MPKTASPTRPHGDDWIDAADVQDAIDGMSRDLADAHKRMIELPRELDAIDRKLAAFCKLRDELASAAQGLLDSLASHLSPVMNGAGSNDLVGGIDRASDRVLDRAHQLAGLHATRTVRWPRIVQADLDNLKVELERIKLRDGAS